MVKILIIDDEAPIRDILSASLKDEGYKVATACDGASGIQALKEFQPDIALLDIWMPGNMDGIEVLTSARSQFPDTEFVMISGHGTIETAVKATKLGAWDFVEKPLSIDKITITIANILNYRQEKEEKSALLNKLRRSIALMGDSQHVVQTKQLIARVAPSHSWILISGEKGCGKHLVAQNIHYMSSRASRPFVEVNCSAIPEDLLEGDLFGIEKGAMPGIDKTRKGKLDLAEGGTLFIDDISEMNATVQTRLLRYLQEKRYNRVGGAEHIQNDVRVIASTQKNLEEEAKAGRFREDLYYRLNVIPFVMAPLREHSEDIPSLISFFSDQIARQGGHMQKTFSEQAIRMLIGHKWPGNVRELKNFVERIYILTPSDFVDVHDLRFAGLGDSGNANSADSFMDDFRDARAKFEKDYLVRKIQEYGGNISKTAEAIGLERSYLHRKIKAYGIEVNS